jgi:SPP1 family predicted phage head-tail adaptor
MIAAGKLRHRITLQELSAASPDVTGSGMPDESWTDLATVNASVEPLSGRELFAAQEHHSEVTTRITIRYRAGINAKQRVSFRGKTYNIRYVLDPEERHRELQLLSAEGVNEG